MIASVLPPAPFYNKKTLAPPLSSQRKLTQCLFIHSIGGGGYVPARILRSFLKTPGSPNIPIQAIGLSLYERLSHNADVPEEEIGTKVTRTQWLDFTALQNTDLVGKNVLIVDEVDDTRTTLQYAVQELSKDVALQAAGKAGGVTPQKTNFFIFVLHVGSLPSLIQLLACTMSNWVLGWVE